MARAFPERAILLAATSVTGAETRQSLDEALSSSPDWTAVIELAINHRMTPALLAALEVSDTAVVPADLLDALREHCSQLRAQSIAIVNELFALLDTLSFRSVVAIPFKGPLLGEFLFADVGMRYPGDLDILVRSEDLSSVCEVLEARGYVDAGLRPGYPPLTDAQKSMYRRFHCEHTYVLQPDGVVVEPHWRLSQRTLAVEDDYRGMLDRARTSTICGRSVLTLAPEDLLLALCIHGAKHHWERLTWIRDVGGLIKRCPDLDFEVCMERARLSGCTRLFLLGLAVARRSADLKLPSTIERMIESDRTTLALEQQVMAWLFDTDKEPPRNDRIDRFRFMIRERWRDRIRYVTRTMLWPRRTHLEIVALPRPLIGLYFPLKWGYEIAASLWRLTKPQHCERSLAKLL
jgi:hypothetical protein